MPSSHLDRQPHILHLGYLLPMKVEPRGVEVTLVTRPRELLYFYSDWKAMIIYSSNVAAITLAKAIPDDNGHWFTDINKFLGFKDFL